MFVPRLTRPESGNPYYNTPNAGGYAVGIILGNPLDAGCNVLANCVAYAAGRFNEIIGQNRFVYWQYAPNPKDWISTAKTYGLRTGTEPEIGCVMVWYHHVAIVERINADGSVLTSESGYGCDNPFWLSTRTRGNGQWGGEQFLGCIYLPKGVEPFMKNGIDISWCQPNVDWSKVQTDFIIIQAGGGYVPRKEDTTYQSHYQNAKKLGIPVGAYWFLDAVDEKGAIEEADIFISLLKGKQFEYPVYLDIEKEMHFKLSKAQFSAVCRAFLARVEAAEYWVGLYTNLNALLNFIEDDIKKRYSIWLAQWDVQKPTYTGAYGIWQNGTGAVAGFPDKVDTDICYVDYPAQIKAKGLNGWGDKPPDKDKIEMTATVNGKTYKGTLTEI